MFGGGMTMVKGRRARLTDALKKFLASQKLYHLDSTACGEYVGAICSEDVVVFGIDLEIFATNLLLVFSNLELFKT